MSRLSITACSTFSSPRKVLSIVDPLRRFFSVVRTKAPPLPGFTCWKSTTWKSPSGRSRDIPRLRSLVETTAIAASSGSDLGGTRQGAAPGFGDHDRVLDADPAVPGEVDARFDGDDVAGGEHSVGHRRDPRVLVDVEPHPVAGAVDEGVGPPCLRDHVATGRIDVPGAHARSHR